jgi:hypothetical protein
MTGSAGTLGASGVAVWGKAVVAIDRSERAASAVAAASTIGDFTLAILLLKEQLPTARKSADIH